MNTQIIELYPHEKEAIVKGIQTSIRRIVNDDTTESIEWMGGSSDADCPKECREFEFFGLMYDAWSEEGKKMPPEWLVYCTEYPEDGVIPVGQGFGAVGDHLVCGDLTLEITAVRIEQLNEISVKDALAEGIKHHTLNCPRNEYFQLWNSVHGVLAHIENPWVWVVAFKLVNQGGDQ